MEEYFVLLSTRETLEGVKGDFFGLKNRRRECLLSNLSTLFESYSKNSMLFGWKKETQAHIYFGLKKLSYPAAQLVKIDVLEPKECIIIEG